MNRFLIHHCHEVIPLGFVTIRKRLGVEAFDAMVLELMRAARVIPQIKSDEPNKRHKEVELEKSQPEEEPSNHNESKNVTAQRN